MTVPVESCTTASITSDYGTGFDRGEQGSSENLQNYEDNLEDNHEDHHFNQGSSTSYTSNCRSYEERKRHLNESWNNICPIIFDAMIESYSPPPVQEHCIVCDALSPMMTCNNCQGGVLYCERCAIKSHSRVNFCHTMDVRKVFIMCS